MAVIGDRVPEVGEVWPSKHDGQSVKILAVATPHVWALPERGFPGTLSIAWLNDFHVPPRKVSREIPIIRTPNGNVRLDEVLIGETLIAHVIVYDDNTIEVKYATD